MEALGGGDQMFVSGRTAMYFHGIWPMATKFELLWPEFRYSCAPEMEAPRFGTVLGRLRHV